MMEVRVLSALEKVFLDACPPEAPFPLEALWGETASFQVAIRRDEGGRREIRVQAEGPCPVHIRQVRHVPVRMAGYDDDADGDVLRGGAPGLYPDRLEEVHPHSVLLSRQWTCLWVDVTPTSGAGVLPITLRIADASGTLAERTLPLTVIPAALPPQELALTRWFHCDGLAQHYHVEPFCEAHWQLIERQLRMAVQCGMNMLLTPVHTPPLDTAVGHERLTTQLVDIAVKGGRYHFGMEKLRRWLRMARGCGIRYFEVAHLYTQWGAQHAPKIIATVDGVPTRIFGWETDALCPAYRDFLAVYIPALRQVFREEGVEEDVRWHISDEPSPEHLPGYLAARQQTDALLQGCTVMDALSNHAFFHQGVVACPVVSTDHVAPFLQDRPEQLWVYYCCAQHRRVSNMFIAWPSRRNRILGMQLFRHSAAGFLHWGWNFYSCMGSHYPIDPYGDTDADGGVPSGDPFQVYPGPDGHPQASIRLMVTLHALQDLRALSLLAALTSRAHVEALLDDAFGGHLAFDTLPEDDNALLTLRQRVNEAIRARLP